MMGCLLLSAVWRVGAPTSAADVPISHLRWTRSADRQQDASAPFHSEKAAKLFGPSLMELLTQRMIFVSMATKELFVKGLQ